uniref:Uncharacterized protein n=1 Tax=Triticum urartu TaxID=4572 RepID=A0A8R7UGU0_TRIUA
MNPNIPLMVRMPTLFPLAVAVLDPFPPHRSISIALPFYLAGQPSPWISSRHGNGNVNDNGGLVHAGARVPPPLAPGHRGGVAQVHRPGGAPPHPGRADAVPGRRPARRPPPRRARHRGPAPAAPAPPPRPRGHRRRRRRGALRGAHVRGRGRARHAGGLPQRHLPAAGGRGGAVQLRAPPGAAGRVDGVHAGDEHPVRAAGGRVGHGGRDGGAAVRGELRAERRQGEGGRREDLRRPRARGARARALPGRRRRTVVVTEHARSLLLMCKY